MEPEYQGLRASHDGYNGTRLQFVVTAGATQSAPLFANRMGLARLNTNALEAAITSVSFLTADEFEKSSDTPSNFRPLYRIDSTDAKVDASVPIAASQSLSLPADPYGIGYTHIRLRLGTAAAPVTATAAVTVGVVLRPY